MRREDVCKDGGVNSHHVLLLEENYGFWHNSLRYPFTAELGKGTLRELLLVMMCNLGAKLNFNQNCAPPIPTVVDCNFGVNRGNPNGGLANGRLGPKGANWAKRSFQGNLCSSPWLRGAEELVPIGPERPR